MKAIKIITHPILLIISFLFILISGQHFGGFYLLYLIMGLPHFGLHAILASVGILLLIFSYLKFGRTGKNIMAIIFNIIGSGCLVLSLIRFFYNDRKGYNNGTFDQLMPQITLVIFGLLTIAFAINNIIKIFVRKPFNINLSAI
jgi:hypothetical protein